MQRHAWNLEGLWLGPQARVLLQRRRRPLQLVVRIL